MMSIIDKANTGDSFYNTFLNDSFTNAHKGKVVLLSPTEYYNNVVTYCFGGSTLARERIMKTRRANVAKLEKLKNLILCGEQLHMPWIDYNTHKQEGLHRMMAIGDLYGWDYPVPVLIVT